MKTALHYFQEELGLSHRQLADLMHTTRSTITRYMTGKRNLPAAAETQLMLLYTVALRTPVPFSMAAPASPTAVPDAETLNIALQRRKQMQRQLEELTLQLQQAAKLELWLTAMDAHPHLLHTPRQQRCIEELLYKQRTKQAACRQQWAEGQQQLSRINDEIALIEYQMQQAEVGQVALPQELLALPAYGQNHT
jgi:transcriptional regulator with XRE-family HTH domain